MPYIKQEDRLKFQSAIENVLSAIMEGTETPYIQGEYFGFFVNRLVRRFLNSPDAENNSFNSAFFNESKKKTLTNYADKVCAMLNRADPLSAAGELNYAVTALYWGLLGEAEKVPSAKYGMRAYLVGILEKVYSSLETVNSGNQRDATMAFRRHLIIRGVLHDVLSETYRRQTGYYEDEKRLENKDIWHLGKLVLPEASEAAEVAE